MPRYDYRCESGHEEELLFPIGEAVESYICGCGSLAKRVFHPVAVSFKGAGFYKTDNLKTKHVRSKVDVK